MLLQTLIRDFSSEHTENIPDSNFDFQGQQTQLHRKYILNMRQKLPTVKLSKNEMYSI